MRDRIIQDSMSSLPDDWRRWRRQIKAGLPYVRRRVFRILQAKYDGLADAIHSHATQAEEVPLQVRVPVPAGLRGEVCLFVTHAAQPLLKTHVLHHLEHLLSAGLQVVLVVNTDLPAAAIEVPPSVQSRLAGVYVRANRGFDFGAWCHVLRQCDRSGWERLYLVNDSVVGPLERRDFDAMLAKIRASSPDLQGLTENPEPIPHLQSYFLVFGPRLLHSPLFARFVEGMVNFPDKGQVVEIYELRFTRTVRQAGFRAEPVFASSDSGSVAGDLHGRWETLVRAGFPYVKTRVLQDFPADPRVRAVRAQAQVDAQV